MIKSIHLTNTYLALLILLFGTTSTNAYHKKINIDSNWYFTLNDSISYNQLVSLENSNWRKLDLPHDWSIEGEISKDNPSGWNGGYFPGGVGWYKKEISINDVLNKSGIDLIFDGVYMNSEVWINDHYLGLHPNGYIGFDYEITNYLQNGINIIIVKVDNSLQPSSRWYTGCGIYRHVWLGYKNNIFQDEKELFVTHDITNNNVRLKIDHTISKTDFINHEVNITYKLSDMSNKIIIDSTKSYTLSKQSTEILQKFLIQSPNLWSPESPNLFQLVITISNKDKVFDKVVKKIGFRKLEVDSKNGAKLNGVNLKFKGVCLHQDAGALGVAVPEEVWIRRLELLKKMGCNSVRTTHHPFAPEFYEICDSLGLMVLNEAFDGWNVAKAQYDYGNYFDDWWKKDLEYFIKRDRNHPSVIMWSIGNEVVGRTDSLESLLVNFVKNIDSTRLVTLGAGHTSKFCDIAGFNGQAEIPNILEQTHQENPDWIILGTEIPHTWQTRGIYRTKTAYRGRNFPAPWDTLRQMEQNIFRKPSYSESELFMNQNKNYISSYDNAYVRISAREQWNRTSSFTYLIGEFRWTGIDYMGENIWPNRGWHCGIMDLAGFPKDHYYLYQSLWTEEAMVHILPHWTHHGKEGSEIPMVVYSNCDEVELFLNDKSLGKKTNDPTKEMVWNVKYKSGKLVAIGMNDSEVKCSDIKSTAREPYKIKLIPDEGELKSNKSQVLHVTLKIVDEDGNFVPNANVEFKYSIKGASKIIGIENGDMMDHSNIDTKTRKTFNGLSLLYIKKTDLQGKIELDVNSTNVKGDKLIINY